MMLNELMWDCVLDLAVCYPVTGDKLVLTQMWFITADYIGPFLSELIVHHKDPSPKVDRTSIDFLPDFRKGKLNLQCMRPSVSKCVGGEHLFLTSGHGYTIS